MRCWWMAATTTHETHALPGQWTITVVGEPPSHPAASPRTPSTAAAYAFTRHHELAVADVRAARRGPPDRRGRRLPLPHGALPPHPRQVHVRGERLVFGGQRRIPGCGLRLYRHHVRMLLIVLAGQRAEEGDQQVLGQPAAWQPGQWADLAGVLPET